VLLTFIQWYPAIKSLQLWENYTSDSMEKLSYLLQITNNHKKWLIVEVCQTSEVDKMVESEDETCSTNKAIIVENDEQQELQLRDQDERQMNNNCRIKNNTN
jgi:hypothetical protein